MTLDQIQHEAVSLSTEERWKLAAFLKHIERVDSPENRAELSRLNRSLDEGRGVTMEQFEQALAAAEAEGR